MKNTVKKNSINTEIKANKVDLVDQNGEMHKGIPLSVALQKATEAKLDLVEVNSTSKVTVCKLMDYGKHLYEIKKKAKGSYKSQKHVKEMKFRPNTGDGDINTKVNKIKKFLESGDDVKIIVQFKGREMAHKDIGKKTIDKVLNCLSGAYKLRQSILQQDRMLTAILQPA